MSATGHIDWHARACQLQIDPRAFIDGMRVDVHGWGRFNSINPQDGTVVASLPSCGQAEVDAAVSSARRAFQQGTWAGLSPHERSVVLQRFADEIDRHHEELALLDTLEMGMPIASALPDVLLATQSIRSVAARIKDMSAQALPSAATTLALNLRVPHGVVAAITPWNFPLYVAVGKIVPALAMGNSVVLKPSELASLSSLRLGDLAVAAGIPAGVLNVVPGVGGETGRLLALHMDVDCLSFTGSTATGRVLMQYSAQSNLKALLLECGGKSPQVVFDDLGDLDALTRALVQGFVWNSGQVCVAGTRLLVARHLYTPVLERMAALLDATRSGAPLDPATSFGPLASMAQLDRVNDIVVAAQRAGGQVVAGGMRESIGGSSHYRPTLLAGVPHGAPFMQEEIFGPVAGIVPFDSPEQALHLANDSQYGLAATLWTRDFALANDMARRMHGGLIAVNMVAAPHPSFVSGTSIEPARASGFGVEGGGAGLLAYTRAKSVHFRLG